MISINPNPSEEDVKTKVVIPALLRAGWKPENYLTEYNLCHDRYHIVPQTLPDPPQARMPLLLRSL